jgi:hypothetical protein
MFSWTRASETGLALRTPDSGTSSETVAVPLYATPRASQFGAILHRTSERPMEDKPNLFTRGRVPWWSYIIFFIVLGLILWLSDNVVTPAF